CGAAAAGAGPSSIHRRLALELGQPGLEHTDPCAQRRLDQLVVAVGAVATAMRAPGRRRVALAGQQLLDRDQPTAPLPEGHPRSSVAGVPIEVTNVVIAPPG